MLHQSLQTWPYLESPKAVLHFPLAFNGPKLLGLSWKFETKLFIYNPGLWMRENIFLTFAMLLKFDGLFYASPNKPQPNFETQHLEPVWADE